MSRQEWKEFVNSVHRVTFHFRKRNKSPLFFRDRVESRGKQASFHVQSSPNFSSFSSILSRFQSTIQFSIGRPTWSIRVLGYERKIALSADLTDSYLTSRSFVSRAYVSPTTCHAISTRIISKFFKKYSPFFLFFNFFLSRTSNQMFQTLWLSGKKRSNIISIRVERFCESFFFLSNNFNIEKEKLNVSNI